MPPSIPTLTSTPANHPDSCLTFSLPLLNLLASTLQEDSNKILSIGSGSGLLETLLTSHLTSQSISAIIHGVEPYPGTANKYLATETLHLVPGTWAVFEPALLYDIWLFAYPREKKLVDKYVSLLAGTASQAGGKMERGGKTIIWAGPRADWDEFEDCFSKDFSKKVYEGSKGGVAEWEVIVILQWREDAEDE